MEKIQTIFDRNWEGNKSVIDKKLVNVSDCIATEKLNGTNVRLTVRNNQLVRLEKRRNPTKLEKQKGMIEPWYKDADEYSPEDKYIFEAARNTDLSNIPDGEWSGEAVGKKIQGNELNLEEHTVFLFSFEDVLMKVKFDDIPTDYEELKKWLPEQKSKFGNNCGIEGIVWWKEGKPFGKIKKKDFKT